MMITTSRPPSIRSTTTETGDPLSVLMRPPPTETEREKRLRLEREADAKKVNDLIDDQIRADRERYKKSKQDVKLLLLGQAESGKSTLQKQFQLMYNPASLDEERLSWRAVIYFNVVRPVRRIFDALEKYADGDDDEDGEGSYGTPDRKGLSQLAMTFDSSPAGSSSQPDSSQEVPSSSPAAKTDSQLANLRMRLSPMLSMEASLADHLSGGVSVSGSGKGNIYVRSGWQLFGKTRNRSLSGGRMSFTGRRSSVENSPRKSLDGHTATATKGDKDVLVEEVRMLLEACREDIQALWAHPIVTQLRDARKLKLEEWAEYFLTNIERVSATGYTPTTDDILHARIQTMGVAEHVFDVPLHGRSVTWHLFDVGGARGQRHTWVPYFDDANAIIFVAPISAFDQYLDEDPRTNRIDDSLQLFTTICSNPLLKDVHLVLFLNKTDILQDKLNRGIRVKKYITSYGDRPNEYDAVVNYFRTHFTQVHKRNNQNKRVLYTHLTNAVDTQATQRIITNIRDSIFRGYLRSAALV